MDYSVYPSCGMKGNFQRGGGGSNSISNINLTDKMKKDNFFMFFMKFQTEITLLSHT